MGTFPETMQMIIEIECTRCGRKSKRERAIPLRWDHSDFKATGSVTCYSELSRMEPIICPYCLMPVTIEELPERADG